MNLIEIEKLASSKRSKTLLTSRPEYFVNVSEESEALRPGINPFLNREAGVRTFEDPSMGGGSG